MVAAKTPPKDAKDAQLDVIPMKKVSPAVWIGAGVGAAAVLGILLFSLVSESKDKARVEELRAKVDQVSSAKSPEELKAQREHLAMTQRALEAAEQRKKQETVPASTQGAQQVPGEPSSGSAAPKPASAQAPPKAALDSIETEALKGLE